MKVVAVFVGSSRPRVSSVLFFIPIGAVGLTPVESSLVLLKLVMAGYCVEGLLVRLPVLVTVVPHAREVHVRCAVRNERLDRQRAGGLAAQHPSVYGEPRGSSNLG